MKTNKNVFVLLLVFSGALFSFQNLVEHFEMDSQTFVNKAAASNMFEIEAGTLATERSQNKAVKDYSQKMVDDHTQVSEEMKTLAEAKNLVVPKKLPPEKQTELENLRSSTDEDFDKAYMELMVKSHQKAVELYSLASGANGVADKELKAFAGEKVPALQMHLKMAKELQTKINK